MDDLRELLPLIASNDPRAADEVDRLADRLRALAARLRASSGNPLSSPGGMSDRVLMQVVGPDGKVKQSIDTQEPSL